MLEHEASSPGSATSASAADASGDSSGALDPTYLPWTIRNKYYEADVHFCIHGEEALGRRGAELEAPAVIVLANASPVGRLRSNPRGKTAAKGIRFGNRGSFSLNDPARHSQDCSEVTTARLANLAALEPCPEVCLLVTLSTPSSSGAASAREATADGDEWEDLALAHGFEWVQIEATDGHVVQERLSASEEDSVKQVSAALHAHMWEGMRTSTPRERLFSSPLQVADDSAEDGQDSLLPPLVPAHRETPTSSAREDQATGSTPSRARPSSAAPEPVTWSFPSTFLPSIPRNGDHGSAPADLAGDEHECTFEDDFSPFMSGPTASSQGQPSRAGTAVLGPAPALVSAPGFEGSAGEEDLDALLARVSLARKEAEGMDMDARRRFAAQMVRDLLGDDAGLDDWHDEEV